LFCYKHMGPGKRVGNAGPANESQRRRKGSQNGAAEVGE
jgi:hypothetical protein